MTDLQRKGLQRAAELLREVIAITSMAKNKDVRFGDLGKNSSPATEVFNKVREAASWLDAVETKQS